MARNPTFDALSHAVCVAEGLENLAEAGKRFSRKAEKVLKPRGKHSPRIRESITEVSASLDVIEYQVVHMARPTTAVVARNFSSRRRAYVYISEMLACGTIRNGDCVSITTCTKVNFK